jgi:hypothetical protein
MMLDRPTCSPPRWAPALSKGTTMSDTPSGGLSAPAPTLVAELWYTEAPDLTDPALLEALRAVRPERGPGRAR